uniref:Phospholipid transfer protein-like n=1 Tax=Stegastes partitus TaxID=144197 RepID=A0A3B5AXH8_9TELE
MKLMMPVFSCRRALNWLLQLLRRFFNLLFCPAVQRYGLPYVNQMLDTIAMTAEVFPKFGISIDYSVTRDVQVTATSLDMSFKGLVFRQGENAAALNPGVDPVFTQNGHMAYVGISDFVFNSGATSFYNAGALGKKFEKIPSRATRVLLRIRQFFTQPWRMTAPLVAGIELTEAPRISITQAQGVTVNLRVRVTTASERANSAPKTVSSVSATCQASLKVTIQGSAQENRLNLPYSNVQCRIVTSNQLKQILVRPLQGLLNDRLNNFLEGWFYGGVPVPLPKGVIFTQGIIEYHDVSLHFLLLG